jgi:magnesium transporter
MRRPSADTPSCEPESARYDGQVPTAVSVVLLPLTLIASIFGMNVPVPGQGDEFAFLGILVMMALLLVGLVAYFRRRGWL